MWRCFLYASHSFQPSRNRGYSFEYIQKNILIGAETYAPLTTCSYVTLSFRKLFIEAVAPIKYITGTAFSITYSATVVMKVTASVRQCGGLFFSSVDQSNLLLLCITSLTFFQTRIIVFIPYVYSEMETTREIRVHCAHYALCETIIIDLWINILKQNGRHSFNNFHSASIDRTTEAKVYVRLALELFFLESLD